jgi:uncharacterized protein YecT (DUF1311 family)
MRRSMFWVVPLVILGGPAFADDTDCKNPPDQTTMNICADRDYKASDKKS